MENKPWQKDVWSLLWKRLNGCDVFYTQTKYPKTLYELDKLSEVAHLESVHRVGQQGKIAVAYTVWSPKKGGGRMIVNEVHKMIKDPKPFNKIGHIIPLTQMAEKFI